MFNTQGSRYLFLAVDDYNNNYAQTIFSSKSQCLQTIHLAKLVKNAQAIIIMKTLMLKNFMLENMVQSI